VELLESTALYCAHAVLNPDISCPVKLVPCKAGAPAQQWRLTALGEIQSALTADRKQLMCLDAARGKPGQHPYTNYCMMGMTWKGHPQPLSRQEDFGQVWRWNTSGAAGPLTHSSSGNCVGTVPGNASLVALAHCDASNQRRWLFPKSGPLTPPAPPRSATAATTTSFVRSRAGSGDDPARMEIARPVDAFDPYLRHWQKTMPGPVAFAGVPCSFPSRIWKSKRGEFCFAFTMKSLRACTVTLSVSRSSVLINIKPNQVSIGMCSATSMADLLGHGARGSTGYPFFSAEY
jgi:hypothetical protein